MAGALTVNMIGITFASYFPEATLTVMFCAPCRCGAVCAHGAGLKAVEAAGVCAYFIHRWGVLRRHGFPDYRRAD